MARSLLNAIGATPPPEPPLDPAVRKRAYERNYEEARQRLAENDLTGALEAARRAQALDPTRTGIIALVTAIEEQLRRRRSGRRVRPGRPRPLPAPRTRPQVRGRQLAAPPPCRRAATATSLRASAPPPSPTCARGAPRSSASSPPSASRPPPRPCRLSPVRDVLAVAGADGAIRLWDLYSRAKAATLRTRAPPAHRPRRAGPLPRLLPRRQRSSLPATWTRACTSGTWAAGYEVPVLLRHEAVVRRARLLSRRVDARLGLGGLQPAPLGRGGGALRERPAASCTASPRASPRSPTPAEATGSSPATRTASCACSTRARDGCWPACGARRRSVSLIVPSPDGQHIAVASHDRSIRLFDLASREQVTVVAGHRKPATSLCFLGGRDAPRERGPGERGPALGPRGEGGRSPRCGASPTESFVGLALFGAGDHIAVALGDGRIRLWGPAA